MGFVEGVMLLLSTYPAIIAFLNPILGGEISVTLLAVLSGRGVVAFPLVLFFSILGAVFFDSLLFNLAESKFVTKLLANKRIAKREKKLEVVFNKYAGKNNFLLLLISKFLYGTRIITVSLLGRERVKFIHFVFYSVIANTVWFSVLVSAGWFAGRGIESAIMILRSAQKGVALLVIAVIVVLVARALMHKAVVQAHHRMKR